MPGTIFDYEDSGTNGEKDSSIANSLEAPVVLGVAVIGLLIGCALYHMCYRKFCVKYRDWFTARHNRGPSTAELRAASDTVTQLFQQPSTTGNAARSSVSNDSLPDYYDLHLPPSYKNFARTLSKRKEVVSQISSSSELSNVSDDPPPYEIVKVLTRVSETTV